MGVTFSYVLPDPASYADWAEFEGDLACLRETGYDTVELQIADPATFDERRVRSALDAAGCRMVAFQTGSSYATRGNCLSSRDPAVRVRTERLLEGFIDLAARWQSVMVFGSLQGRVADAGDAESPSTGSGQAGAARIRESIRRLADRATERGAVIAYEPVNHLEVGFNHTMAEVAALVREIDRPGVKLMIDTFHMNIEERDMLAPLSGIADLLVHVHLSETNRDVLGAGHWPTGAFLAELAKGGYAGACSIGVYNSRHSRRDCMRLCMQALRGN